MVDVSLVLGNDINKLKCWAMISINSNRIKLIQRRML